MGDKDVGQTLFPLQTNQQIDDLCLDGNVQSGDGLVADNQFGLVASARAMAMRCF